MYLWRQAAMGDLRRALVIGFDERELLRSGCSIREDTLIRGSGRASRLAQSRVLQDISRSWEAATAHRRA